MESEAISIYSEPQNLYRLTCTTIYGPWCICNSTQRGGFYTRVRAIFYLIADVFEVIEAGQIEAAAVDLSA